MTTPIRQLKFWPHGHRRCTCYECRIQRLRVKLREIARALRWRQNA